MAAKSSSLVDTLADRVRHEVRLDERGEVPGWVVITIIAAGVVAMLTAVAGPQIGGLLSQALFFIGS